MNIKGIRSFTLLVFSTVTLVGCNPSSENSSADLSGVFVGTTNTEPTYQFIGAAISNHFDFSTSKPTWLSGSYIVEDDNVSATVYTRWGLTANHSVTGTMSGDDLTISVVDDDDSNNSMLVNTQLLEQSERVSYAELNGEWQYNDGSIINDLTFYDDGYFISEATSGCIMSGWFYETDEVGYFSTYFNVFNCDADNEYANGNYEGYAIALQKDHMVSPPTDQPMLMILSASGNSFYFDKFLKQVPAP